MQVSVETVSDLERKLTIQVPPEGIEEKVDARLRSLAKSVKIDGFRPGKVPFKEVKRRYAGEARREALDDVIQSTLQDAIEQQELQLAGAPNVVPKELNDDGFTYEATFEVYPEIKLVSLSKETVTRDVAKVEEADIDNTLEKLQTQRVTWNEVDREAAEADQLTIDFEGFLGDEAFEGGKGADVQLVLGSGSMIPGFEDQLIGVKAGEARTLTVTFPEGYQAENLAGKEARFETMTKKVCEPVLPEINDDFAASLGIEGGTVDALRAEVRENMQREMDNKIQESIKKQVLTTLVEKNGIPLPKALVDEEIKQLMQQMQQQLQGASNLELPPAIFEEKARERVAMGLLMGEVIKENALEADVESVQKKLEELTASYEDAAAMIENYKKNPTAMRNVAGIVLEDKVVEVLLDQVTIKDNNTTFEEVMKLSAPAA